ncbi:MAG: MogA/MoaB family molybdenum cofactor biosynthesis protein, partial [Candidatus Delongbacteria bacterium]
MEKIKIQIITLSDRASKGIYEDKSGPAIKKLLKAHFADKECNISIDVIPDDRKTLKKLLEKYYQEEVDAVFTTGGTGVGPRDITPEVVTEFSDKVIPGIMEHIRIKYGEKFPNALLSRSIAALKGKMVIYSLPGSVKAASEYT